jgi:hypothetical protein
MKLQTRQNDYGHIVIDCPFCEGWVYRRAASKTSPDPARDLKRHITNAAKNEAFAWMLVQEGDRPEMPHLDYYRAHTSMQPLRTGVLKRQYDNDLEL